MKKLKKWVEVMIRLGIIGCLGFVLCMRLLEYGGIQSYIVRSGSMEPEIKTGSVCFVDTRVDYKDIQENDIIAFERGKIRVTHRVIQVTEDGFITKGDNNELSDGLTTNEDNYIGKSVFAIPWMGYVLSTIQTTRGKIIAVTAGIAVLLIQEGESVIKK